MCLFIFETIDDLLKIWSKYLNFGLPAVPGSLIKGDLWSRFLATVLIPSKIAETLVFLFLKILHICRKPGLNILIRSHSYMRPCRSNWPHENSFFDISPTSYPIFLKFLPLIDLVKIHLFAKFDENLAFGSLVIVHWNLDLWTLGLATLFNFSQIFQVQVILYPKTFILY